MFDWLDRVPRHRIETGANHTCGADELRAAPHAVRARITPASRRSLHRPRRSGKGPG
jgi:hypothetical protein